QSVSLVRITNPPILLSKSTCSMSHIFESKYSGGSYLTETTFLCDDILLIQYGMFFICSFSEDRYTEPEAISRGISPAAFFSPINGRIEKPPKTRAAIEKSVRLFSIFSPLYQLRNF